MNLHTVGMLSVSEIDSFHRHRYVDDLEDWDPSRSFYAEIGSIFGMTLGYNEDTSKDAEILRRVGEACQGDWWWTWDEYQVFETNPVHHNVEVIDVWRRVWFHFDSKDDAMLSRITVSDLRNARYADSGRMPKGVESSSQHPPEGSTG